jgi:hypothetical protein
MKNRLKFKYICLFTGCIFLQNSSQAQNTAGGQSKSEFYTKDDFKNVEKYDTHVHINIHDTTFIRQAKEDNRPVGLCNYLYRR